ncbi:hypothetical protein [Cognatishimia sp.]|uniref:hypothetical protein n=1 Tax=Cognatishimia sp. TaxID=2211648 RepID=UPI0035128813
MLSVLRNCTIGLMCLTSPLSAQSVDAQNVFFGFDFVLVPIAIKWACGGESTDDLSRINAVVDAFPEDAEQASMGKIIADLDKARTGEVSLSQIVGGQLSTEQEERLCKAATLLNLTHLSPDSFHIGGDNALSKDQQLAWQNFFLTVENLSS